MVEIPTKLANNQNVYIICLQEVSTCIRHVHFYDTWKLLEQCLNAAMAPIINAHGGTYIMIHFPIFSPNRIPRTDWCQAATVNGQSPCLNNGQCRNECLNYVCICIPPFTAGRNCESFQCSENGECLNGGTCDRGPSGMNQAPMCLCPPGRSGARTTIIYSYLVNSVSYSIQSNRVMQGAVHLYYSIEISTNISVRPY
ncbi:hypothetical protein EB796_020554 [Bugula neritina]|uniref:EGF-like domain-containing protein n=1 Tax=Bugula neritina TaxID=10212 RepID=A0A7J7J6T8_BUGNE|nr:hypothetical protein EB796_020554 [Bugula neritina]